MTWISSRPASGLVVYQPKKGFRYGAEAFWLTGFALQGGRPGSALDFGTGSGVVAMLLGRLGIPTTGVDVRTEWEDGWRQSLAESEGVSQVQLQVRDVTEVESKVELVVSNPPFFPRGAGPASPDVWRAAARTESTATVADFSAAALSCLVPGGRACFVIPADRYNDLVSHGFVHRVAWVGRLRVLVELRREPCDKASEIHAIERDPTAQGWYELAQREPSRILP